MVGNGGGGGYTRSTLGQHQVIARQIKRKKG